MLRAILDRRGGGCRHKRHHWDEEGNRKQLT
jgi:hypothetical protein